MKPHKQLNQVIRKIQQKNNCNRTDALNTLSGAYPLSYVTLWSIAKHGKMLKRKKTQEVLFQIFKDYL